MNLLRALWCRIVGHQWTTRVFHTLGDLHVRYYSECRRCRVTEWRWSQ